MKKLEFVFLGKYKFLMQLFLVKELNRFLSRKVTENKLDKSHNYHIDL